FLRITGDFLGTKFIIQVGNALRIQVFAVRSDFVFELLCGQLWILCRPLLQELIFEVQSAVRTAFDTLAPDVLVWLAWHFLPPLPSRTTLGPDVFHAGTLVGHGCQWLEGDLDPFQKLGGLP